ncbi:hypothetical protein WOLCODRAFT_14494 [Wolfiporia cocos MD-104 SS10]|uniref:C3H1-type domain-containing protein n=1 Tax=Wolfiporia cocos (strain MD-104) TaxID=742152 RepID=A0A2H3J2U1_WOLCO|nr:hypothetical protein WOLCODRAFT_14494 [Wolfiporia cocos MD-104 SS10]
MRDDSSKQTTTVAAGHGKHIKLDVGIFDAARLENEFALEGAMSVLECYLENPVVSIASLCSDLLGVPLLFEFAISGLDEESYAVYQQKLLDAFPTTSEAFLSSPVRRILNQLSLFLLFEAEPFMTNDARSLRDCRQSIESSCQVLEILLTKQTLSEQSLVNRTNDPDAGEPYKRKAKSQRAQKVTKRARLGIDLPIDRKPFDALKVQVPANADESAELASNLLADMRDILLHHLQVLRDPRVKERVKMAYLPQQREPEVIPPQSHTVDPAAPGEETSVEEKSNEKSVYQMVQPIKATLYFNMAEDFGEWRIIVGSRAERDLRQARRKNPVLFDIIIKKMKQVDAELSNGHFSADNHKPLTGPELDIPVYEAKMTGDTRLVTAYLSFSLIGDVSLMKPKVERQVIKIFGIYTHAQLDGRFWSSLSYQLGRSGREYKRRCIFRSPRSQGNNKDYIMPACFPPMEEEPAAPPSCLPDLHQDDLAQQFLKGMSSLRVSAVWILAHLKVGILTGEDIAHVFGVSSQEKIIIENNTSSYVIGRSGTGKTTTMLFKMLGIERSWSDYRNQLPKPRQVFVTQSYKLVEKVRSAFYKYRKSLFAHDEGNEFSRIEARENGSRGRAMVNYREEGGWNTNLPQRFGDLQDEHFPLFITYDEVRPIDKLDSGRTIATNNTKEGADRESDMSLDYMHRQRTAFISYPKFVQSYWAHFPQPLVKGLAPAVVFGEIMGVIEGSEGAHSSESKYLAEDTYLALSSNSYPMFASRRDCVYELFKAYTKHKANRKEYDACDSYVDEVQDHLLIDTLVLRYLCRNSDSGLFWAGDTAQAISVGSSFRFNDLKAFMYRVESRSLVKDKSKQETLSKSRIRVSKVPKQFQLTINYRSHAGIVNCAQTIIDLIRKFWPNTIDQLARERGRVDGLKPVYLLIPGQDIKQFKRFLFGHEDSDKHVLGAKQCILVRDDDAREQLRGQVGKIGTIMTLYESKGLEFDDVLLYHFFHDSNVELKRWRVVLNAIAEEHKGNIKAPEYHPIRHNEVCRELKFLYVAITRARMNLWIVDDSEKGEPMRRLWRDQVRTCTSASDVLPIASTSAVEEWEESGDNLFDNEIYGEAMHAYEHAKNFKKKAIAKAYYLRHRASIGPLQSQSQSTAFLAAANAFQQCAQDESLEKERTVYFRIAAECFESGGDDERAASSYYCAGDYASAAKLYLKRSKFDHALDVIKNHRQRIPTDVVDRVLGVLRIVYLREENFDKAKETCQSHEESSEELLTFAEEYGLDSARTKLLTNMSRINEAADLYLEEGRALDAIRLLKQNAQDTDSAYHTSQCLLHGLRRYLAFGFDLSSHPLNSHSDREEIFHLLTDWSVGGLTRNTADHHNIHISPILQQINAFKAQQQNDRTRLTHLSQTFKELHRDNVSSFRYLDYSYSKLQRSDFQDQSTTELSSELDRFCNYARLLRSYAFCADPCNVLELQQLFGFDPPTGPDNSFLVRTGTHLHNRMQALLGSSDRVTARGILAWKGELNPMLYEILQETLHRRVACWNEETRHAKVFQPCLAHLLLGQCKRERCPKAHVDAGTFDESSYNRRVRIHLQQFLIYQTQYGLEGRWERLKQLRMWLYRLNDALLPAHHKLGSLIQLRPSAIPEFNAGLRVACSWIRDLLYGLTPYRPVAEGKLMVMDEFLTSLMVLTSMGSNFDRGAFCYYIHRIPSVAYRRPPPLMQAGGTYTVQGLMGYVLNDSGDYLSQGLSFLCHVVDNRLDVDCKVLCDLLDNMCASLVLEKRYRESRSLHGVVLPQNWFTQSIPRLMDTGNVDERLLRAYLRPISDVLGQLSTGVKAEYLRHEGRGLEYETKMGWFRDVMMARICANMIILGFNMGSEQWLRPEIVRIIDQLHFLERSSALPVLKLFARGHEWFWREPALQQYYAGSKSDPLVLLRKENMSVQPSAFHSNIRHVVYRSNNQLPSLFSCALPKMLISGDNSEGRHNIYLGPRGIQRHPIEGQQKYSRTETTILLDSMATNGSTSLDSYNAESEGVAENEANAARTILKRYRRYIRDQDMLRNPINAFRKQRFAQFQKANSMLHWPHRRYRMLFLGPVPHLLVFLDCAVAYSHTNKRELRRDILEADPSEVEKIQKDLTATDQLFKEAKNLENALVADAQVHKDRDVNRLRALLMEVSQLGERVPKEISAQWGGDLEIAAKGIGTNGEWDDESLEHDDREDGEGDRTH